MKRTVKAWAHRMANGKIRDVRPCEIKEIMEQFAYSNESVVRVTITYDDGKKVKPKGRGK